MAGDLFGGFGREFFDMIDERLSKPPWQWSLGTWVLGVIVLAVFVLCASTIYHLAIKPSYRVAGAIMDGSALKAVLAIHASIIFQTLFAIGLTLFLLACAIFSIRGAFVGLVDIWESNFDMNAALRKALSNKPAKSKIMFWIIGLLLLLLLFGLFVPTIIYVDITAWQQTRGF